mmetsp:Transcript_55016/g.75199  ORF Transcript_55016/g.75199 Transcript_55016/m.75199 type:complete len:121 (+) Transcript_55016:2055-2417(+)
MAWKHGGGCSDGARQPFMRVPLRVRDPKLVKGRTPVVADPQASKKDGTFVPKTITLRDLRAKWRKDELKLSKPTIRHGIDDPTYTGKGHSPDETGGGSGKNISSHATPLDQRGKISATET